jgi:ribosomal protein L11 methyltransferase
MRELVLTIPREAVDDVLDRLLPIAPAGVREVNRGDQVELLMRGAQAPGRDEAGRAAGAWPHRLRERTVPDDWRERRLADYEPEVIADRIVVRPAWAPSPPPGLIDVALTDSAAFGGGRHPTTRTCLELLAGVKPFGSFADLGCGSGVIAIAAAALGWAPVSAVDVQPVSVEAVHANAALNGVAVAASALDLLAHPPPLAAAFAANVPPVVHERLAALLASPLPSIALVSGFGADEAPSVLSAYAQRGLRVRVQLDAHGWIVALLERGLRATRR